MKKTIFALILLVVTLMGAVALARSVANSQGGQHDSTHIMSTGVHSMNAGMQHGEHKHKDHGAHDGQHEHGGRHKHGTRDGQLKPSTATPAEPVR
jgi:hypothetical protein